MRTKRKAHRITSFSPVSTLLCSSDFALGNNWYCFQQLSTTPMIAAFTAPRGCGLMKSSKTKRPAYSAHADFRISDGARVTLGRQGIRSVRSAVLIFLSTGPEPCRTQRHKSTSHYTCTYRTCKQHCCVPHAGQGAPNASCRRIQMSASVLRQSGVGV